MYNSVERNVSYKFCKSFDKRLANTRKRPVICPVFLIFCPVFVLREVGGRTALVMYFSLFCFLGHTVGGRQPINELKFS
jgi:hypothetical protein